MKIRNLIIMIILFLPNSVFSQWAERSSEASGFLSGIYFLDYHMGWIVYTDSCLRTIDGGQNWEKIFVGSDNRQLYDVAFVNNVFGIATSSGGMVYRSFDGGVTWTPRNTGTGSNSYFGIAYLEDTGRHTWIVGTSGTIAYSNNDGDSWTVQESGSFSLNDVYFIDKNFGWAVGNNGTILHTSTGGNNNGWNIQQSNTSEDLFGVWFLDSSTGWAVGDNGVLIKTENGGQSWQPQPSTVNSTLIKISFSDYQNGVIVGTGGVILHTQNGGIDWVNESGIVNVVLSNVYYPSLENCWAVGQNGTLLYSIGMVSITTPSGGEKYEEGTQEVISWESSYTEQVRIDLSTNNGSSWDHIVTNQTSALSGSSNFTVPNMPSSQCKIRILSLKDPEVQAISPPFEIFEKTLELLTPSEGITLIGGNQYTIKWTHINVEKLKILFRESPNTSAILIAENVDASELQYIWEVAEVNSDQCQIIISEMDGSPIASSGFFTIKYDNIPPVITIDPLTIRPKKGEDLLVEVKITDENATSNTLFFRQVGDTTFSENISLIPAGNNMYQATIPASTGDFSMNERGLEFYIKSVDSSPRSNTSNSNIIYRPVSLSSSDFSILSSEPGSDEIYQMFASFYELNEKNISTVLEDDLGPYDKTQWRLWQWQTDKERYGELNTDEIGTLSRGKSFWIASVKNKFTIGAGQSYSIEDYILELQPGWNQIGHPFAFPVNYTDIIDANTNVSGLSKFYDYKNPNWVLVENENMLEPRKGYFIKNMNQNKVSYKIPAIAADRGPASGRIMKATSEGWKIQLQVRNNQASDAYNYVGMQKSASPEWDQLDQPEPPPAIGKYISLYFPHDEWQQYPDHYTYDFRPETEDLQVWNIEVETNVNNPMAEIKLKGVESVPFEFEVYILDETQRIFQNLRKNPIIKISTVPYPDKKELKLIIGKEDDIQQYNLINDKPDEYELYQSFPNPFELTTTIPYSIPTDGKVTLRIYNIRGELVTILLDGIQKETGHHLQTWNAQDSFGQTVSSGLYFYQIIIGDFSRTKKMFLKK